MNTEKYLKRHKNTRNKTKMSNNDSILVTCYLQKRKK